MLRIKSTIYLTGQANHNNQNLKFQTYFFDFGHAQRRRLRRVLNIGI